MLRRVSVAALIAAGAGAPSFAATADFNTDTYTLPSLGLEKAINGGFPTDLSGWTVAPANGATIVWENGGVRFTGGGTAGNGYLEQSVSLEVGKLYEVSFSGNGSHKGVALGSTQGGIQYGVREGATFVEGKNSVYLTATATLLYARFYSQYGVTTNWLLDNFSVKEVLLDSPRAATRDEFFAAYTASSTAARMYVDNAGVLRTMDYDRANYIRNNSMQGAVAGTPGTLPTGWSVGTLSGTTRTIVGTGIEDGIDYIDIRFSGTATALGTQGVLNFEAAANTPAANGQVWAGSVYCKLVGGSLSNVLVNALTVSGRGSDGSLLTAVQSQFTPTTSWQRVINSTTLNHASVAQVLMRYDNSLAAGPVDFTLRFGLPQLEPGSVATTAKRTTGTAATAVNQPRFTWEGGKRQLLLENQVTNQIRNNSMQGTITATTGPTNWSGAITNSSGLTLNFAGKGIENGIEYIDIVGSGTATSSVAFAIEMELPGTIAAANGQVWTLSAYMRLISGSMPPQAPQLGLLETDSSNVNVINNNVPWTGAPRVTYTRTIANANTAFLRPRLRFTTAAAGEVWNFTIRVMLPQLEQNSYASSPIRTAGAAVTRAIETFRLSPLVEAIIQRAEGGVVLQHDLLYNAVTSIGRRLIGGVNPHALLYATSSSNGDIYIGTFNALGAIFATLAGGVKNYDLVRSAVVWRDVDRTVAANGVIGATDNQAPGTRTQIYVGRDSGTSPGIYGDGRYDFLGILASRPSNSNLQALTVVA
jgi:hypothetical protein